MYDMATRRAALASLEAGGSLRSLSLATGISRSTLRTWMLHGPTAKKPGRECALCASETPSPAIDYLYLLGLYLGDGCISEHARTTALRIACAESWPGLLAECAAAMSAVSGRTAFFAAGDGCRYVTVLWRHWPCLFPQHGPGMKHTRSIALQPWQQELVAADPRPLIRGLVHSDGCRITNWTEQRVSGTTKRYTYPRYFFNNVSDDIRGIFTDALDLLGIAWRQNRWNSVSVARREAVAALDEFVGPKY